MTFKSFFGFVFLLNTTITAILNNSIQQNMYVLFSIEHPQCSIESRSYYDLDSQSLANCCTNKLEGQKCGQLEGPCKDHNDCLSGYTCSES